MNDNFVPVTPNKPMWQRLNEKMEAEGVYRKGHQPVSRPSAVQPEPEPEPTAEESILKLMQKLPKEERDRLLDEYEGEGNEDAVQFFKSRLAPKQEQQEVDQVALQKEYDEKMAKIPAGWVNAINILKREYRAKGLKVV